VLFLLSHSFATNKFSRICTVDFLAKIENPVLILVRSQSARAGASVSGSDYRFKPNVKNKVLIKHSTVVESLQKMYNEQ